MFRTSEANESNKLVNSLFIWYVKFVSEFTPRGNEKQNKTVTTTFNNKPTKYYFL